MSEEQDNNIRRFGRRNQKNKLERPESLFPPEHEELNIPEEITDFDIDSLNLPDNDDEALAMLSSLQDEVRAPIITPQAERYPPLAPNTIPSHTVQAELDSRPPPELKERHLMTNFLTVLFLLGTVLTAIWFAIVWDNPQSALNPLSPPTPFRIVTVIPDANTASNNMSTPDADGQIFVVITDTPAPTVETTPSPFPFIAEPILYAPNSNELACNWWSIAGTVTDLSGNPISGYGIRIRGNGIDEAVFSGASQSFGAGGFELPLVGTPQEATFTVQLFTGQNVALSDEIMVDTRSDCDSNVAVINFVQNR